MKRLIAAINAQDWPSAASLSKALIARFPDNAHVLYLAAMTALNGRNQPKRAHELLRRCLEIEPNHPDAAVFLHDVLLMLGDAEGALDATLSAIENHPFTPISYYNLAVLDTDRALALRGRMEELAVNPSISDRDRAALFTALGRVYERQGRLDAAMKAYLTSKQFRAGVYPKQVYETLLKASRERFAPATPAAPAAQGLIAERRPVFILGLPRSGSSLIDRIIASHSQASSAGERPQMSAVLREAFATPTPGIGRPYHPEVDGPADADEKALQRAARAYLKRIEPFVGRPEAPVWIDKMPANFRWCGAIMRLFPDARVIMTDREPRDTMLSGLRSSFSFEHDYCQSVLTFAHYYSLQQRFTALWREVLGDRFMVVRYEELVGDLNSGARRIIEHVGLPWEDACARPEQTEGAIHTASAAQVRQPVHSKSVGGWRKYEQQFAPLTAQLERGPWAVARQEMRSA